MKILQRISDFEEWNNNEQNGYHGEVPDYRMIKGDYKAWNPYRGWNGYICVLF